MVNRLPSRPPVLPGYTYIAPLGTGGFADVFLFEQQLPRRAVAIKVLLKNVVNEELLRLFNSEADAMATLSAHPSIVTIFEANISADGRPYITMEHCPFSYRDRYRKETIPVAEVLTLGIKIGSALETAHRAGMLHRDIKPSNILITEYGSPVLSDFGIATTLKQSDESEILAMSVPWSAPEVVAEESIGSVHSEVWSLGATIYTLLAGHSPFERPGKGMNTREKIKKRIAKANYSPIKREDVPDRLNQLLRDSMHKDPSRRFSSVLEMVNALQLVQQEMGLGVTNAEIASNRWAPKPINFADTSERGQKRSVVTMPTKRRAPASPEAARRPDEEGVIEADSQRGKRFKKISLVVGVSLISLTSALLLISFYGGL